MDASASWVFISYSSVDRQVAEEIEKELKGPDCQVWRDQTRLDSDWPREISEALVKNADVMCLVWTAAAANSKWVQHEWLTMRALGKRIIPCLYPQAPPLPPALTHLHGIVVKDHQSPVPKIKECLRTHGAVVPYDYSIAPPEVRIPFARNRWFVGREGELADIYLDVVGALDKRGISLVGLDGMGGVGKTQMAAEFVARYGFAFRLVHWIPASRSDRWVEMLVDLASTRLKLSIDDPHGHDAPIRYIAELRKYFQSNPGCLLVLDNVEDPRQLAGDRLIPGIEPTTILSMGSSVLFTSRQRFDLPGVSWRRVGILPEAEATRLLTTGRDPASQSEIAASKEICNAVGYLPLALVLANGFLRDAQSVSYREYRESLSRDLLGTVDLAKMSEEELATRHVAAIEKTLDVQLANLERDALALLLIKMCSFFGDAEMVPRELLENAGTGIRPPGIERPFDRAIHRLLSGNLLEEFADGEAVQLHPLLRAAIAKRISLEEERRIKREAVARFKTVYDDFRMFERTYLKRGIDHLLFDVAQVAAWGRMADGVELDLVRMFRVLSQSASILRSVDESQREMTFSQQVALRSLQFGLEELKEKAEHRSGELKKRCFTLRWVTGPGGTSLLRTIPIRPDATHHSKFEALSRNGRYVVGDCGDRKLQVSDALLGVHLYEIDVESRVFGLTFVGATSCFVIAAEADALEIWDAAKGERAGAIPGCSAGSLSVTGTRDGTHILCLCGDGAIRVWRLESLEPVEMRNLKWFSNLDGARPQKIYCGSSGDRVRVVVACDNGTARVGELEASIEETRDMAIGNGQIAVSADGKYAFVWSGSQSGDLWNLETALLERSLKIAHPIVDVAIATEAGLLIATDFYGGLHVFDFPLLPALGTTMGAHGLNSGASIAVVPDGSMLVSAAFGELKVWNVRDRWPRSIPPGHATEISSLAMRPTGKYVVSGSGDRTVKVWKLDDGTLLQDFAEHRDRVNLVCDLRDGSVISFDWQEALIWMLNDKSVLKRTRCGSVTRIRSSGTRVVSTMFGGSVFVADAGHRNREIGRHANQLNALTLVDEDSHAVTGAGDGTIHIWNLVAFRDEGGFKVHEGSITDLATLAGTPFVVSSSWDGAVKMFRWKDGSEVMTLKQAGAPVHAVATSPSGKRIVAAHGATITVWSAIAREELGWCSLWDNIRCLLMPADDLIVCGDAGGNLYCLRFGL